ncbi:MAG: hypothetical protein AAF928_18595 [Myxococcota bacterium]
MSATIDSQGEIEVIANCAELAPNRQAKLHFRLVDLAAPPFQIRVRSPSGKLILERVIRELPTGEPQSPPPITFTVQAGRYEVDVVQLRGTASGKAHIDVG